MAGTYLFLLGLSAGITLLAVTSFRRTSPAWLKWLLTATGLFLAGHYITLALLTTPGDPKQFSLLLRLFGFADTFGLTLPGVMVLDQLLRHPAMSPKKLLVRFSPFLVVYAAITLLAPIKVVPDRTAGWALALFGIWPAVLFFTQAIFLTGFIGISVMLMRKIPSAPIRKALFGLTAGYLYLAVDFLLAALGKWYFRPFLFSELAVLLAFWHAYETSSSL